MAVGQHHRATLKKGHKAFKSKHSSKSSLKNQQKGVYKYNFYFVLFLKHTNENIYYR